MQRSALREDRAIASAVDLDHLEPQRAPHLVGERLSAVRTRLCAHDLRHGDERVDALHVGQQAALVIASDFTLEDVTILEPLLEDPPPLLAPRAVDGQQYLTFVGLRLHDVHEDRVAYLQARRRIRAQRMHLVGGNHAFRLRPDVHEVDQDAVPLGPHDHAFDDLASA